MSTWGIERRLTEDMQSRFCLHLVRPVLVAVDVANVQVPPEHAFDGIHYTVEE